MITLHIRQEAAGKKHKIRLALKRSGQLLETATHGTAQLMAVMEVAG